MCGFACIINGRPTNPSLIEEVLSSRGPDGRGLYESETDWMLHRRLAILDLDERSDQPFHLDDGSVLLYNGELYNHRDFDAEVPSRTTSGDTEIVAHLGDSVDAVARFRGMYAYGLHRPDGTVTLVRDRLGIKPLYVKVVGNQIMYASQLRCFTDELGGARLSQQAEASFLRFGAVVSPTMFEGVFELPAGHMLRWKDGRILSIKPVLPDPTPITIAHALRQSMRRHLVSDTPTCILLSGGLDSAVLAKLASEEGGQQIEAITLSVGGDLDEIKLARRTADHYGLRLHEVAMTASEAREASQSFVDAMDQPSIDGLNIFLLSKAVAARGFKVALSGLGSDELFGGYPIYRNAASVGLLNPVPDVMAAPLLRRLGRGLNPSKLERIAGVRRNPWQLAEIDRELRTSAEVAELVGLSDSTIRPLVETSDALVSAQFALYMRPRLLRDADAFSMACSVELRVPFLDDEVVAAAMGESALKRGFLGKRAIVDALDDEYLQTVLKQPKKGFDLPMAEWFDMPSTSSQPWGVAWSDRVLEEWKTRHFPQLVSRHDT